MANGQAARSLTQLGGQMPLGQADAGGDEHLNDVGVGVADLGHLALGATEQVGGLLGLHTQAEAQVVRSELNVSTVTAGRSDESHYRPLSFFLKVDYLPTLFRGDS